MSAHPRLRIVCLSFDWRNLAKTNVPEMRAKFERDGIRLGECDMFLVSFGPEHYYLKVDEHFETVHLKARSRHLRPFYALLMALRLPVLLHARGFVPDVVLTYDMSLVPAASRVRAGTGARVALFIANLPSTLLKTRPLARLKLVVEYLIERLGAPRVDVCFVNSNATASYAIRMGISDDHIHRFFPDTISPDGRELVRAYETKGALRARLSIPHDSLLMLSVGRLEPEKGFDRLLNLFAELHDPRAVLVVAGEGKLRDSLEEQVRMLGIASQVRFVGRVPHAMLWRYYVDADVFILLSRSESLGMVALEAMYARTPCVLSHAEGLRESAGDESERAFLWDERDGVEALRSEIECIRTAHPMVAERVARAHAYVEKRLGERSTVMETLLPNNYL